MLKVYGSFDEMMATLRHKDEKSSLKEVEPAKKAEDKPKKKKKAKAEK